METEEFEICEKCEESPGIIKCECDGKFCQKCYDTKHLPRHPEHQIGGTAHTDSTWSWISGKLINWANKAKLFKDDETAKWFGLQIEIKKKSGLEEYRIGRLVETARFTRLVEESIHHNDNSPRRQFPSITSFIGDTGVGKSTIIRSLIKQAENASAFEIDQISPIPGENSNSAVCSSTTGEVNLYLDPETFGTAKPHFFADCEGMLGTEPAAAQYQKDWSSKARRKYPLEPKNGRQFDRKTAVMTIYPRFLYIFSDVICMVTQNEKTWADTAVKLLEWSGVGAHNTINQYALPALIIVLNAPKSENKAWLSDDSEAVTKDFFNVIEKEISENVTLSAMAKKSKDKSIQQLFERNFSSIYVHYIPLKSAKFGSTRVLVSQIKKLAARIRKDAAKVQADRDRTWSLFDSKQLGVVMDYAFNHLASGTDAPFDLGQFNQEISVPDTQEGHFAGFLGRCLHDNLERNFEAASSIVACSVVRNSLRVQGSGLLHPAVVFNDELKRTCRQATEQFLNVDQSCSYKHPKTDEKCINSNFGHAKGHQPQDGSWIIKGSFVKNDKFDVDRFIQLASAEVERLLKVLNNSGMGRQDHRHLAAVEYRNKLRSIPDQAFWTNSFTSNWTDQFNLKFGGIAGAALGRKASVCYGCLFGRPEYKLPCNHVLCSDCVREFDESPLETAYPGIALHRSCILCESEAGDCWPMTLRYRPSLGGIRVLSLDGGGVRGIVELSILQRLEQLLDFDMPLGEIFDLMVGTSAGGMIALALGIHKFKVEECTRRFRALCETVFQAKALATTPIIGWFARIFYNSIYDTSVLESAIQKAFDGSKVLFGHQGNTSKVVVTTTIGEKCHLFANYNWGDGKRYLNSSAYTWTAARCTSAAPMYFEPMLFEGSQCRDGGLKENNPLQVAIIEAKTIWGTEVPFDTVISIGTGYTNRAQSNAPTLTSQHWLKALFKAFIENMNGEAAWHKFKDTTDPILMGRVCRLNVKLDDGEEPALDDVGRITPMETLAAKCKFQWKSPTDGFNPVSGRASNDLEVLAARIRASQYFFELRCINDHEDVTVVEGWICCRLLPYDSQFGQLIRKTSAFRVKESTINPDLASVKQLRLDVRFQQQTSQDSAPLRIDVKFEHDYYVSISGFPMTLKALKSHWERR